MHPRYHHQQQQQRQQEQQQQLLPLFHHCCTNQQPKTIIEKITHIEYKAYSYERPNVTVSDCQKYNNHYVRNPKLIFVCFRCRYRDIKVDFSLDIQL